MIVIPIEKRFDWAHVPLAMIVIVLLNIMVFFFYQSGDNEKIEEALSEYETLGSIDKEWPIFKAYLKEQGELELIKEYQALYDGEYLYDVSTIILLRSDFYPYLNLRAREQFYVSYYGEWSGPRERIQHKVDSLSYLVHGLFSNKFRVQALFSYQFLHGDLMHLLGNMLFLIICGFAVEAAIGHLRFVLFYLGAGVAAGLAQVAFNLESTTPLVGASGAISGVMAMYLAVFQLRKIEFFYWLFIFVGYFRAPALLVLPFYIGNELYSYYANPDSNVAFMAHAGGFVVGALLMGVSIWINPNILNIDYIEEDQNINPKQHSLAQLYGAIEHHRFDQALSLVSEMIDEFGLDFDLAVVRYNLLNIQKGDDYKQSVIALAQMKNLEKHQLNQFEKIWRTHTELYSDMDEDDLVSLGLSFTALDDPSSAEGIFIFLYKRQGRHPKMGAFAGKLADAFSKKRNMKKNEQYTQLSERYFREASNGTL